MGFTANMRRLLRHRLFRSLLGIRCLTQAGDAAMQVGLASHVLFNPANAPDAWAIATMLAITLLPFSLLGPFVSGLLDHWPRRQVTVAVDGTRAVISLFVVLVLWQQGTLPGSQTMLFGALMVALALNRFLLAGLTAALQHTIDADEFLTASAVMPLVGPLTLLLGGAVGLGIRLLSAPTLGADRADALIFVLAALLWLGSVSLALRLDRLALGPTTPAPNTRFSQTWHALSAAMAHLSRRLPASLALVTITGIRVLYGATMTTAILLFRNHFNDAAHLSRAMGQIGTWMGASAAGFAVSVLVVPPVSRRVGMRATVALMLACSAVTQATIGSVLAPLVLTGAAFVLGAFSQSLKICVDTIVQAHVGEQYKGRVFVVYDALYNAAIVLGAVLAAFCLPPDGASRTFLLSLGGAFAALAAVFWVVSGRIGSSVFNRGTGLGIGAADQP